MLQKIFLDLHSKMKYINNEYGHLLCFASCAWRICYTFFTTVNLSSDGKCHFWNFIEFQKSIRTLLRCVSQEINLLMML
jgi:hypothetical protein